MLMYVDTRCYSSGSRGTVRKEREQKQTRRKMAKEEQQQQQHRKKSGKAIKKFDEFRTFCILMTAVFSFVIAMFVGVFH